MVRQRATQPTYMMSIYDDPDALGALRFTFVPKSTKREFEIRKEGKKGK